MLIRILKKLLRQIILLAAVSLVLLAAYVSIGRQFMPAISQYTQQFEEQFSTRTGVPISVDSLNGSFQGFNPTIIVNGLSLLENEDLALPEDAESIAFGSASLTVDVGRSIWTRQIVLSDFVISDVEVNLLQTSDGVWQTRGLKFAESGSTNLNDVYRLLSRFTTLSLANVTINMESSAGDEFSLTNGSATIQNFNQSHFIHINANPEDGSQQIAISLEVVGDEFDEIDGQLHIEIPHADYSNLFSGESYRDTSLQEFVGGGDFWFTLQSGQIASVVSRVNVDRATLLAEDSAPFTLTELSGESILRRNLGQDQWEIALSNISVSQGDQQLEPLSAYINYSPNRNISFRADRVDLSFLVSSALESGLLDESVEEQLQLYTPRGALSNFSLSLPLEEGSEEHTLLRTNIESIDVASVNGSPSMWGINGYAEIDFDPVSGQTNGLAEVESDEFSINIPNVFTRTWDYSYVNGSVGFNIDTGNGTKIRLVSGMIVAESGAVDGHVQFTTTLHRPPDEERISELELVIGVQRVDAIQKDLYLPDAPTINEGLLNTMQWLSTAILDGDVYDSGVIYRGSTVKGSAADTKTFQGYFQLVNGELEFSEDWPQLESLDAGVYVDDGNVDIAVNGGESLGLELSETVADIRRNDADKTWLAIEGKAGGLTGDGLAYLQSAPVGDGLKTALADWQADGEFGADIKVLVPFSQPDENTDVRLDIAVDDNELYLPQYELDVTHLTGPILFDTRTGLEQRDLVAEFFGESVDVSLSSDMTDGSLETILVDVNGTVGPEELIAWPLQSSFVNDLLREMSGSFDYQAQLTIDQTGTKEAGTSLFIASELVGASLSLPRPFEKDSHSELPLQLQLDFSADGTEQLVKGTLGSSLTFELEVEEGELTDGLVFLGERTASLDNLLNNDIPGLVIVGRTEMIEVEEWTRFLVGLGESTSSTAGMNNAVSLVDVNLASLQVYGQELPNVRMQIRPDPDRPYWAIDLSGDSVLGDVYVPFDINDYLELSLNYLRLPGDEEPVDELVSSEQTTEQVSVVEGAQVAEVEVEEERIDPLADIDPRNLPKMKFSTADFSIGDRPFGNWSFTLDPTADGASFSELAFDFRGLRLGMEDIEEVEEDEDQSATDSEEPASSIVNGNEAGFDWSYDGSEHRSSLTGTLYADNLADLLTANGYAASLESSRAVFTTDLNWPGSPAFFGPSNLSGELGISVEDGRFLQGASNTGALKLISLLNFNAIMSRLKFSDDIVRSGLAYDEITAELSLEDGLVNIEDRLVISGPSSLYQIVGEVDLDEETILGEMYITLPVSSNIPWIGLLTANIPLAVGAYLFDRIFGSQVDSLTSAIYTLDGPWEGIEPEFKQAFGSPDDLQSPTTTPQ